jgi:hypothetical protein
MSEIILADPAKLDQPVKNPTKIDQDKRGIEMEITYSQLVRKTKAPGRQIDIDHIKELSFL